MWFPRPQEEFTDGVYDYIDEKIQEWTARSLDSEDDEERYACSRVLEVLEDMNDYFHMYPDWPGII